MRERAKVKKAREEETREIKKERGIKRIIYSNLFF